MDDEMKAFLEGDDTPDNILDGVDSVEEPEVAPLPEDKKGDKDESVPPTDREAHTIPINALLDEREKRQKAQRELEEMQRKLEQYQKPQAPDTSKMSTEELIETRVLDTKIQLSRFHAEKEFGKETVEEAIAWFDKNPQDSWKFADSASPMHDAVEYFKKAKLVEAITADPEAYIEAQVQARLQKVSTTSKEKESTKGSVPPSIASKASAGRGAPQQPGGFESLFNK